MTAWPREAVALAEKDAIVISITERRCTTSLSEEEYDDMPKQPVCKGCNKKLKPVPVGNGWAHKKREHWTSHPHKAVPVFEDAVA